MYRKNYRNLNVTIHDFIYGKVHLGTDSGVEDDAEVERGVAHHHLQAPQALRVEGAHKQVLQDARHFCRQLLGVQEVVEQHPFSGSALFGIE